jgi:exonuclease VII small subunit
MNEQQIQFDSNLKLLAEGTLSLSEKDKQYQVKMEMMRKELNTIGQSIEARLDTKLTTYENGQSINKTTIETQMEHSMKRYSESMNLMEKRLANLVEDKGTETKKVT